MKYVVGLLLLSVAVCGVTWPGAAFMRHRYAAMARADDRLIRAARVAEMRRVMEDMGKEIEAMNKGQRANLPIRPPIEVKGLQLPAIRGAEEYRYATIASNAQMGFVGSLFLLFAIGAVAAARSKKEAESVDREPAPDAGKVLGEWVPPGTVFIAQTGLGARVEIDRTKAEVVFHHLAFIATFASNPERWRTELPFSGILSVEEGSNDGRSYFTVRTTLGKVVLKDDLQPFEALGKILTDIGELNRTSPEAYAAAAAREPVVRTPWYGWLILAAALGGLVYLMWYFMYRES